MGVFIHTPGRLIHTRLPASGALRLVARALSVRVQELPKSPNVSAEIVVVGHLALDLLAAM